MSEPVIRINLTVEQTQVMEALAETQQQARQVFEQAFVSSLDKAEKKLYELTRDLQNLNSVIGTNKQSITDLESKRASAGSAEQARINAEIKALETLNRQHQESIATLEQKRVKQEATIAATRAASEQEKLAIQLVAQERLIDIGIMRDAQRAREVGADAAVRGSERERKASEAAAEAAAKGAEKITASLDTLISRQLAHQSAIDADKKKVEELYATHNTATNAAKQEIEQEIASVQRAISGGH